MFLLSDIVHVKYVSNNNVLKSSIDALKFEQKIKW